MHMNIYMCMYVYVYICRLRPVCQCAAYQQVPNRVGCKFPPACQCGQIYICVYMYIYLYMHIYRFTRIHVCIYRYMYIYMCIYALPADERHTGMTSGYGVATISRLLKIIGLFCRLSSL